MHTHIRRNPTQHQIPHSTIPQHQLQLGMRKRAPARLIHHPAAVSHTRRQLRDELAPGLAPDQRASQPRRVAPDTAPGGVVARPRTLARRQRAQVRPVRLAREERRVARARERLGQREHAGNRGGVGAAGRGPVRSGSRLLRGLWSGRARWCERGICMERREWVGWVTYSLVACRLPAGLLWWGSGTSRAAKDRAWRVFVFS